MFGITTQQQLPVEYLTNYSLWDIYMATVWAALLNHANLDPQMTVIEIAPGTSTKIGLALEKCHFRGKLYVVEPEKASLAIVCDYYRTILPDAKIFPIHHPLVNSIDLLPKHADFILANHPLDDMLMAIPFEDKDPRSIFDWTLNPSNKLSPLFLERGSRITSDVNHLRAAKMSIIQQWKRLVHELNPSTTMISQYPSSVLAQNHLQALNQQASEILNTLKIEFSTKEEMTHYHQIQSILNQLENYNNAHIGTDILNVKNWFVHTQ